jgi:pilus assembly protein CpaB
MDFGMNMVARMRASGRTIAIVAAVLLAAIATIAIVVYVRGIEQRAFEQAELVEVLVAQQDIDARTPATDAADAGQMATGRVPRTAVPEGAVEGLDEIEGLVAVDRILEGEVILSQRWSEPDEAVSGLDIPEGFEAISVQVGVPPGVAGHVRATDRVSLIAHVTGTTAEQEDGAEAAEETRAQYLLQDIEVLGVGQRTAADDEDGQESSQVLLTVALEPEDAERLVFAINEAALHFTLLPEGAEPAETPGRTFEDLFN